MIEFKILKKSEKSQARLGVLKTCHGEVETPAFVPVATQGVIKTLTSEEVLETKTKILICNTYHLHLRPGEKIIKGFKGLHKFMNWPKALMTDSGGFQVFSLGFGRDLGISKILKKNSEIELKTQPNFLKITNEGVLFRSHLDGNKVFIGPKESIKIQESLGADIIFAFDECPPPAVDFKYMKKSLERTHLWADICLKVKQSDQALFGIVQGGRFKSLRTESADFLSSRDFDGFGIGGEFGSDKKSMIDMIGWTLEKLPKIKPRHLLGIGQPDDILKIIKAGVDTFDCIIPTHYARRGIAFTRFGSINIGKSIYLNDKNSLDSEKNVVGFVKNPLYQRKNSGYFGVNKKCSCFVCQNYSRSYLCHLFRAGEITALKLLTFHNLWFFNSLVEKIRDDIKKEKI
ncbi:MAG: tRNA guanosine(34) transglycosylase Tgt [Candidatus Liptonbacteria bacterium]|nr:tRNA guanosine(34) transglycosylase Tgt [Candidatus Liptonbacteria bacterium]